MGENYNDGDCEKLALYIQLVDDAGNLHRFSPEKYQHAAYILKRMFDFPNSRKMAKRFIPDFSCLREIYESVEIATKIERSRSRYYPHLDAIMKKLNPSKTG